MACYNLLAFAYMMCYRSQVMMPSRMYVMYQRWRDMLGGNCMQSISVIILYLQR